MTGTVRINRRADPRKPKRPSPDRREKKQGKKGEEGAPENHQKKGQGKGSTLVKTGSYEKLGLRSGSDKNRKKLLGKGDFRGKSPAVKKKALSLPKPKLGVKKTCARYENKKNFATLRTARESFTGIKGEKIGGSKDEPRAREYATGRTQNHRRNSRKRVPGYPNTPFYLRRRGEKGAAHLRQKYAKSLFLYKRGKGTTLITYRY